MLLRILAVVLVGLAVFGVVVCALERRWGVFAFSLIVFSGLAFLLAYGAGHTTGG